MKLVAGKRYEWTIALHGGKVIDGLFTGEYDERGFAVFLTKWEDEWHVPVKDVRVHKK